MTTYQSKKKRPLAQRDNGGGSGTQSGTEQEKQSEKLCHTRMEECLDKARRVMEELLSKVRLRKVKSELVRDHHR